MTPQSLRFDRDNFSVFLELTGYFSVTAEERNKKGEILRCGCMHDMIKEQFPEHAHLIKWHLCGINQPIHYVANTLFWAKEGNLEFARNSAIWPDATIEQLSSKEALLSRLPQLMNEFHKTMKETFNVHD